jgi:hypothetical protein
VEAEEAEEALEEALLEELWAEEEANSTTLSPRRPRDHLQRLLRATDPLEEAGEVEEPLLLVSHEWEGEETAIRL